MTTANAVRATVAICAIVFAAVISVATGGDRDIAARAADPSVPPAAQVLHSNDGRPEGNVKDLTY